MAPTGRTVALAALAAATAVVWPVALAAALLAAVLVAFVVDATRVASPPEVEVRWPAELVRGVPAAFEVDVVARPGTSVRTRQPQTAELRVEPTEAAGSLAGTVVALTRGTHHPGGPVTRSTGPLGLAAWVHRHPDPPPTTAHTDLPGGRRIALAVRAGTFRDPGMRRGPLGLGTDFESIREYTPDDDIRRVNWLAGERTGHPMVNTYREDTERDLWCLVDAGRLLASPVGDRTRLDVALDALTAVAAVAEVAGDRIGSVVFDDRVRRVVRPRKADAAALCRSLDDVVPAIVDSDYDAAFQQVATAKRALVMVFTDVLDGAAATPLLAALPVLVRRHVVAVAGIVDPDLVAAATNVPRNADDLLRAGVAGDLLDERADVVRRLRAAGAVVVDQSAERLPGACVATYLRLKATARL
ncbi:MAG: DUF58 domain-containing protein [Actinobacteria bacterium]|nr:DUF58 domain-containing protein [Actinomycetota bacterium]